jgi:hypothetical protein
LLGKPVLYAFLSDTDNVMNELVEGLVVPSPVAPFDAAHPEAYGRSVCPRSAVPAYSTTGQTLGKLQVQFGYDVSSGCAVELNRTELINLCCAGSAACVPSGSGTYDSPYADPDTGIPYFLDFTQG